MNKEKSVIFCEKSVIFHKITIFWNKIHTFVISRNHTFVIPRNHTFVNLRNHKVVILWFVDWMKSQKVCFGQVTFWNHKSVIWPSHILKQESVICEIPNHNWNHKCDFEITNLWFVGSIWGYGPEIAQKRLYYRFYLMLSVKPYHRSESN